ncbi:MAG: DUF2585 family protein [Paracoccaceae bacterium]
MSTRQLLNSAAVLGGISIFVTLWIWGQPLICTCGYAQFWVGSIWSSGNSQHVADWYTLSHIVHGLLIVPIGRLISPKISFNLLFFVAITTGITWEIVEHTDWVLDQFRATTVNQGYLGDSVLNAVADYSFMMAGFFISSRMPTLSTLGVILTFEATAAFVARDSLLLTTMMLLHRFEAIEEWQQEINPRQQVTIGVLEAGA